MDRILFKKYLDKAGVKLSTYVDRCTEGGLLPYDIIDVAQDFECAILGMPSWDKMPEGFDYWLDISRNTPDPEDEPDTKGAVKHDSGKLDLAIVPRGLIEGAVEAFKLGETKYGRTNYAKGGLTNLQLCNAAYRHLLAYINGEDRCPVDGQSHLSSILASIGILMELQRLGKDIDDRESDND